MKKRESFHRSAPAEGQDALASTRLLGATLAATVLTAAAFIAWPGLDLAVASWFVRADHGFIADVPIGRVLRQAFEIIPFAVLGLSGLLYGARRLGRRVRAPSGAALLALGVSLALGPGLLVNTVLKDHSHRPRPVQTTDFGGPWTFRPFYRFDGECRRNCSFVSGEGALGAWVTAPAMLVPPPWRTLAITLAALLAASMGALRMAFGGHFLSDTLFAALFTWLIVIGCFKLAIRLARPPTDGGQPRASTIGRQEGRRIG